MFKHLKEKMEKAFARISEEKLYVVDIDQQQIIDIYINSFNPEDQQEHTCNCCRRFIQQYGGIVAIINGKLVSIWDFETEEMYAPAIKNLREYVLQRPIKSRFFSKERWIGTSKNFDEKRGVWWEHFSLELKAGTITSDTAAMSKSIQDKQILERSLESISEDAMVIVLDLIDQNTIYRGAEFKAVISSFLSFKRDIEKSTNRDLACWDKCGTAIDRMKNMAIGTLLTDITEGKDLDASLRSYERIMAPTNYKRPTALVTPKMIDNAKTVITELGLSNSLDRRFASETDLNVENILYTDKSSVVKDPFDLLAGETKVDVKKLSKVTEISIDDFISKVLPNSKSIEVLVENPHLNNFVSLITSDDNSKLFKWDNNFSWDYTGGVADSIKERVKTAGGNVNGVLRASLSWHNTDDLDIHSYDPRGRHIYFGNKSANNGTLDIDMNVRNPVTDAVENIVWTNRNAMLEGTYSISVNNFSKRGTLNPGFTVQIECDGVITDISSNKSDSMAVVSFNWTRAGGIDYSTMKSPLPLNNNNISKEKWNVKTNTFTKVKKIMLSPNHWNGNIGNKHYFFILENCISDESPRIFSNEFLSEELNPHRKVLELLGSRAKVYHTQNQLSGLGFSSTNKNSVYVRVEGNLKQTLKVNF